MNFSDAQPIFEFSAAEKEQEWASLHRTFPSIATDGRGRYFYSGGEKETLGDAVHAEVEMALKEACGEFKPLRAEILEKLYLRVFQQAREEYERQFPG